MAEKITGRHLEALTLLGGAGEEVRFNVIFNLGKEDLLNAVLDLVEMKFANRRTQPIYTTLPIIDDEIFYSLSDLGKTYYHSLRDYANELLEK